MPRISVNAGLAGLPSGEAVEMVWGDAQNEIRTFYRAPDAPLVLDGALAGKVESYLASVSQTTSRQGSTLTVSGFARTADPVVDLTATPDPDQAANPSVYVAEIGDQHKPTENPSVDIEQNVPVSIAFIKHTASDGQIHQSRFLVIWRRGAPD